MKIKLWGVRGSIPTTGPETEFYGGNTSCVTVSHDDYVLVLKDNTRPERNLKVAFSKHPAGPYSTASAPFTPNFTEGPSVARVKEGYVIYYDQYREKIYGAVRTKDFKSFEDVTKLVDVPEGHKHGTIFRVEKKFVNRLKKQVAK